MKAARCAPTLCGGKPNDLAAGTASYRLNFLAARLDGTENPTKRPAIRQMSVYVCSEPVLLEETPVASLLNRIEERVSVSPEDLGTIVTRVFKGLGTVFINP